MAHLLRLIAVICVVISGNARASWQDYTLQADALAGCRAAVASRNTNILETCGTIYTDNNQKYYYAAWAYGEPSWTGFRFQTYDAAPTTDPSCQAKPPFTGVVKYTVTIAQAPSGMGSAIICTGGCAYYQTEGMGGFDATATHYGRVGSFTPTGNTCTTDPNGGDVAPSANPSSTGTCQPLGGSLTQCYDPTTHTMCAITPRGAEGCWSVGDTGARVSSDQKEALTKTNSPTAAASVPGLVNAEADTANTSTQASPSASPSSTTNIITYANSTGVAGTAAGTGTGTGTDMTATNAKLDSIISNTSGTNTKLDTANASLDTIKHALDGTSTGNPSDTGAASAGTAAGNGLGAESTYGADGLSSAGYGFNRSCPTISDVVVMGRTIHFDTSKFCEWQQNTGLLVLIIGGIVCLRMFGSAA